MTHCVKARNQESRYSVPIKLVNYKGGQVHLPTFSDWAMAAAPNSQQKRAEMDEYSR